MLFNQPGHENHDCAIIHVCVVIGVAIPPLDSLFLFVLGLFVFLAPFTESLSLSDASPFKSIVL